MSANGHKRTSGNFPETDALSIAGDVNLALPKGHSAPTVGVTVARRRIQSLPEKNSEMTERISLEGKVAVVTGAGRGLGRALRKGRIDEGFFEPGPFEPGQIPAMAKS